MVHKKRFRGLTTSFQEKISAQVLCSTFQKCVCELSYKYQNLLHQQPRRSPNGNRFWGHSNNRLGGLRTDNVRAALEAVQPYGLDLCSGVRILGKLDPFKLEKFFEAVAL